MSAEHEVPNDWPTTIAPKMPDTTDVPDTTVEPTRELPAQPSPTTGPTTPSVPAPQPADAVISRADDNEDERLDEALQETMPTSDPVSIKIA